MQFLRMVKSELRRLVSDKKAIIIFFVVFAALITLVTLFLSNFPMNSFSKDFDDEALIADYEEQYELYHSWYLYEIGEAPCPGDPNHPLHVASSKSLKELCDYYKFLVDTHTTSYDYIETMPAFDMYSKVENYNGSCSMLKIAQYSFYPLALFSIVWAVISCVNPYERGMMKNYSASPVDKRAIMGGKLFAAGVVNFCVWFIVLVWGLIFGSFGKPLSVLDYTANGYVATPANTVFVAFMLGTLFAMLFMCCFTVLVGQFIKKSLPSALASVAFLVVLLLLCSAIFHVIIEEILEPFFYYEYFPVLGLNNVYYNFADWRMWVTFVFHIIIGAIMVLTIILLQKDREFHSRIRRARKAEK